MRTEPPVAERAVPAHVSRRVRETLMATTEISTHRPRFAVVSVAATVVVMLAVVGVVVGSRSDAGRIAAPLPPVSTAFDHIVATDLGPLSAAGAEATLARCLRPEDPAVTKVVSARRLTDGHAPFSWVAYENVDDQLVICSNRQNGPTFGNEQKFLPTAQEPVVALGGMTSASWLPDQTTSHPTSATDYSTAQLFAAGPDVDSVQLRAVVNGVPGAWFAGKVDNGFVLVPLYDAGPVPLNPNGEPQIRFDRRAFDRNGMPVRIKT